MISEEQSASLPQATLPVHSPPASAAIMPLTNEEVILPITVDPAITVQLKNTREQREVVGPVVQYLTTIGWRLDQMQFGRREWRVPRNPSQASVRDQGQSYEGFPVDIAIFDSPERLGDPHHLLVIIETKTSDDETGVNQLETYIGLEPHTKVGVWSNSGDPSASVIYVFRNERGQLVRRRRLLSEMPRPGEPITDEQRRLTFTDLTVPSAAAIKKTVEDMLDRVVIQDSNVTRREEQLDQLCNLFLLKLHSDKRAKLRETEPPMFRPLESAARTAEEIRREFARFVAVYPDTFDTIQARELRLSDQTIQICVEMLSPYRLIDVGVSTLSLGFQVLRAAALRQKEGQYFTPQPVIEAGVRLLKIDLDDLVIDPACGTGGFLVDVFLEMQRRHPNQQTELSRWAQTNIHGIDKDSVGVKLTKAIMQIAGDGSAHCVRGDSVRTHLWARDNPHLNQPAFENGRFSVVVTNPPFGQNLKVSANDARLSGLDIAKGGGTDYRDMEIGLLFLQRAYQLLRVGGRLGIILPETYFFSPQYRFLLDWLRDKLRPTMVANVPMEAFQGFCRAKTNFYIFEKINNDAR